MLISHYFNHDSDKRNQKHAKKLPKNRKLLVSENQNWKAYSS
ncbi:hypothetical protein HMPREF9378_1370 [Streptococcus sanguinis SK1 = NCTC 7863]|uniref:Uncharacterized protein n=3 Tax=Streptococcus sanguinis TaxID=1305 RepID=F3UD38_STRSA|nr:hypothetical protein HMPREF9390_1371 [Streptococcus sanguinis SK405]EGF06949.1 hypothetical protein HMPREF9378_1370 [Streptococcus sanguinis SK1 = NCTC 7863]EGF17775.1 hypothetical protein HMPREF9391_1895 [Streptococcus sanguinis SK408]EGF20681.1 hypothetical protein HMPREF9395_1979 [Streptococcus sanguinis SK1058]EGJ37664.1 hypothetical protein HMPREF9393_1445 [Streptococcus sanguinis SK1056]EGJ43290.1 hypothetical protein HMPREF9396_1473 [Streptococcus sanguinis SK1059]EGQ22785.1 hypothe